MSKQSLVNINPINDSTPLDQAYVTSLNIDKAAKAIGGLKSGIYSRLRRVAREVYQAHLERAKGNSAELNGAAMSAEFKEQLGNAEAAYAGGAVDDKQRKTWVQNKSNLSRALTLRFDFAGEPEVSASVLANWCKDTQTAIDEAAEAAEAKAYREKHGLEEPSAEGDGATGAGGDAPNYGEGIAFANDEQEIAFQQMIQLMIEVSAKDPSKLNGIIKSANNQLDSISKSFLKKMAAA